MAKREYSDPIDEMRDRLRRIETRLMRFMEAQGFDTQVMRPVWRDGAIHIPSKSVSLQDVLDAMPPMDFRSVDGEAIRLHGELIGWITTATPLMQVPTEK